MVSAGSFTRVILLVLDSVGIGAMPDADQWGDAGSDTLGHVAAWRPLQLAHLGKLGLAAIRPLPHLTPPVKPMGAFGKAAMAGQGKDTTTGHWEMAGLPLSVAFPTYPKGFPPALLERFEKAIGRGTLGNRPASGTEIIKELGSAHIRTGKPIVYTSADSVFQMAAHEEVIPVEQLYDFCEIARCILEPPHQVGRVIARPFLGTAPDGPDAFKRTVRRRDYAIPPPEPLLLARLQAKEVLTVAIGKISDIYCGQGVTRSCKTISNADGIAKTLAMLETVTSGLLFANLVDFDMLYGHRNDVAGYAAALEEADVGIGQIMTKLRASDLLIITADHGCDPSTASTDHSREYVPLLVYSPRLQGGVDLGTRSTLADIGQTIAENFGARLRFGTSFLSQLA